VIRRRLLALVLLVALAGAFVIPASAQTDSAGSDWPMFHHDAAHTGYTASEGPRANPTALWTYKINGSTDLDPVIDSGKLYFSAHTANSSGFIQNTVFCFDALTGEENWNFTAQGLSTPCVYNGFVYTGDHAFNASTGELAWGPLGLGALSTVSDEIAYLVGNSLYACNASNGKQLWNFTYPDPMKGLGGFPTVAEGMVYVSGYNGIIYAFNSTNGESTWSFDTTAWVTSTPAVVEGRLYVGTGDRYTGFNYVYCFNASTGGLIWRFNAGSWVTGSPAVANERVYVGSMDDYVYALDAMTGQKVWSYKTGNDVGSPAVAGNTVYVASKDGNLYAFDASTGSTLWVYGLDSPTQSSPAVANGLLYIGTEKGTVIAIRQSTNPNSDLPLQLLIVISAIASLLAAAILISIIRKSKKTP
jgi:eukaryotic-like serine/threonine-protein kinase